MGKPQSRKGSRSKNKQHRRLMKAKHISRHIDLVYEDLQTPNKFEKLPIDEDLPGLGQFYCIQCSKYFVDERGLGSHRRSKDHKKMGKKLKEKPYDLKEAAFLSK